MTVHAEALRALLVAKRSARSTRIRTIVQLRHLMFTAPDELRAKLGGLTATQLVNEAAKLRPRRRWRHRRAGQRRRQR